MHLYNRNLNSAEDLWNLESVPLFCLEHTVDYGIYCERNISE